MNPNTNKYLVIFILVTGLAVGAVLVYTKNYMKNPGQDKAAQELTQFSSQANPNTVQQAEQTTQNQNTSFGQGSSQTQPQQDVQGASNQQQASQQQQQQQTPYNPQSLPPAPAGEVTQLEMKDEVVGTGPAVKSGDTAEVNYIGTFLDGKKFDSSYGRGQTFSFQVGGGQVIKGWDEGLVGMQVGGRRLLIIPSDMAYGSTGSEGAIPPNTPLMFEVELVSIKPAQ